MNKKTKVMVGILILAVMIVSIGCVVKNTVVKQVEPTIVSTKDDDVEEVEKTPEVVENIPKQEVKEEVVSVATTVKPIQDNTPKEKVSKLKDDFSNAIFIGDSITFAYTQVGNTPVPKQNVYAKIGGHVFEGVKFLGNDKNLIQNRCNGSVDYVFIMFGANDYGYEMNSYKSGYKQLIHSVRGMFPNAKIVVQSVMPMNNVSSEPNRSAEPDKLNKIVKEIAKEENVQYLDVAGNIPNANQLHVEDGLHFKADLYPLWVNVIKNNVI